MANLVPIKTVEFDGETIRTVIITKFAGADKMFMIFESGKVVVLPVSRECPVQVGTIEQLAGDLKAIKEQVEREADRLVAERQRTLESIEELIGGCHGMDIK